MKFELSLCHDLKLPIYGLQHWVAKIWGIENSEFVSKKGTECPFNIQWANFRKLVFVLSFFLNVFFIWKKRAKNSRKKYLWHLQLIQNLCETYKIINFYEKKQWIFYSFVNSIVSSIYPLSILYQSSIYPLSILYLSSIYPLSILYQSSINPLSILYLSSI